MKIHEDKSSIALEATIALKTPTTETIVNSLPLGYNKMPNINHRNKRLTIRAETTATRVKSTRIRKTTSGQGLANNLSSSSSSFGCVGVKTMAKEERRRVELRNKLRFETNLVRRGFPILLILVCSLIIVNTKCDQVGSANGSSKKSDKFSESFEQDEQDKQMFIPKNKVDPLSMLREIYLDHNSKIITMLLPPDGDPVQKFHPNGRYGRRSVDNFAESRAEFGKLVSNEPPLEIAPINDSSGALRSILRDIDRDMAMRDLKMANRHTGERVNPMISINNNQIEPNKLLRCNYVGVSNLYACNAAIASNQ